MNPFALRAEYRLLCHHIYELNKGVRHLGLLTLDGSLRAGVEAFLSVRDWPYFIAPVGSSRMNVLVGKGPLVEVASRFLVKGLDRLSPEEDFILGTLLGYGVEQQVERYLHRSGDGVDSVESYSRCVEETVPIVAVDPRPVSVEWVV